MGRCRRDLPGSSFFPDHLCFLEERGTTGPRRERRCTTPLSRHGSGAWSPSLGSLWCDRASGGKLGGAVLSGGGDEFKTGGRNGPGLSLVPFPDRSGKRSGPLDPIHGITSFATGRRQSSLGHGG